MGNETLVRTIEDELLAPRGFREGDRERLQATLGRFGAYLSAQHGLSRIENTTLEALRAYPFDLKQDDDGNLRLVFRLLERDDLLEHLSMVSADKYFRNKKLSVALKAVTEFSPHVRRLRQANVRMASDLLETGATSEGRARLSDESDVPVKVVLQIVQACDLCRMTGMAGKTLTRSIAMGYDTLDAFRASTPERIREELNAYLAAHGERTSRMIDYASCVQQARRLADVIE